MSGMGIDDQDVNGTEETQMDSSSIETSDTSAGEDTVTNDEVVSIKKSEWSKMQSQVSNLNIALEKEREKTKRSSLSPVEGDEAKPKKDEIEEKFKSFQQKENAKARQRFEEDVKNDILKRFPSLADVNDFGIKREVVENYQVLLEIESRKGFTPRTKEDVSLLVERAVRMVKPDLFVERQEELGRDYSGMSRGSPLETDIQPSERLTPKERAFHDFVNQKEKMNKYG